MVGRANIPIAPNTKKSQRAHYDTYCSFCLVLDFPLVPVSTNKLSMNTICLAQFLLTQLVYFYLKFVGLLHKKHSLVNPLSNNWLFSIVLKEVKRVYRALPGRDRQITTDILCNIHSTLNFNSSNNVSSPGHLFGLSRKSHFLPRSCATVNQHQQFVQSDFSKDPNGFLMLVCWSKTIQFGQHTITIALICFPARCLQLYVYLL